MKIMHRQEPWNGKANFIDDKGTYLGFDYKSGCCEQFGWFLSDKKGDWIEGYKEESMELPGWHFDPAYYVEGAGSEEGGGRAEFRIVNGDQEKFLTIYNHHNGYYGHGFQFTCPVDTTKNREGCL